jgi:Asp/Glu/hydantoin racemase
MVRRIVLIHAVTVAMPPIEAAFRTLWPAAERINLLDDSLSPDRARDGRLTPAMTERFRRLGHYAATIGAHGILFTCSAFGPAIEAVAAEQTVPVLKPNQAMFEAALAHGRRIGMLATFAPSIAPMTRELEAVAPDATLETVCAEGAMAALQAGDGATHDRLLAEAAPRLAACDAVMLAHFSTGRAEAAVAARLDRPVLAAPGSAVQKLKAALEA